LHPATDGEYARKGNGNKGLTEAAGDRKVTGNNAKYSQEGF
jgi:hypothetical protein